MRLTSTLLGKKTFIWVAGGILAATFIVMPITAGYTLRQKSIEATNEYREATRENIIKLRALVKFAIKVGGIPLAINSVLGFALAFAFAYKLSKDADGLEQSTKFLIHDIRSHVSSLGKRVDNALCKREDPVKALESMAGDCSWILSMYDQSAEVLKNYAGNVDGLAATEEDVSRLVGKIASFQATLAEEKGVAFNLTLPLMPVTVKTYRDKLYSVLLNTVDNAVKYTDSGSVTVELTKRMRSIRLVVKDTGPGLSKEEAKRVKMNLYRASGSSDKPGMGYGMTIINSRIALLKGDFDFHPVEGKGTTCTVTLPLDMTRKPSRSPIAWLKMTASKLSKCLIFENKEKRGVA